MNAPREMERRRRRLVARGWDPIDVRMLERLQAACSPWSTVDVYEHAVGVARLVNDGRMFNGATATTPKAQPSLTTKGR